MDMVIQPAKWGIDREKCIFTVYDWIYMLILISNSWRTTQMLVFFGDINLLSMGFRHDGTRENWLFNAGKTTIEHSLVKFLVGGFKHEFYFP